MLVWGLEMDPTTRLIKATERIQGLLGEQWGSNQKGCIESDPQESRSGKTSPKLRGGKALAGAARRPAGAGAGSAWGGPPSRPLRHYLWDTLCSAKVQWNVLDFVDQLLFHAFLFFSLK